MLTIVSLRFDCAIESLMLQRFLQWHCDSCALQVRSALSAKLGDISSLSPVEFRLSRSMVADDYRIHCTVGGASHTVRVVEFKGAAPKLDVMSIDAGNILTEKWLDA